MDSFAFHEERTMPIRRMAAYCSPRKDKPAQALPLPVPRLRIRGSGPQDMNATQIGRGQTRAGQDTCRCPDPDLSFAPVPPANFGSYSDPPLARGSLACKICGKRRGKRAVVHQTQSSPVYEQSFHDIPARSPQDRRRRDLEPVDPDSDISSSYTIISSDHPRRVGQRYTRATTGHFSDDSSFSDISMHPTQERRISYTQSQLPRDHYYTSPQYDRPRHQQQQSIDTRAGLVDDEQWPLYESTTSYYKTPATRPRVRSQEYIQPISSNAVHHRPLIREDSRGPNRTPFESSPIRHSGRRPRREERDWEEDRYFEEERDSRRDKSFAEDVYIEGKRPSRDRRHSRERRHSEERWEPHHRDSFEARPTFSDEFPTRPTFSDDFQRLPRDFNETKTRRRRDRWDEEERDHFSPEVTSSDDGFFDSSQVRYVNSRDWPRRKEDDDRTPSRAAISDLRDEHTAARRRRTVVVDGW